MAYDWNFSVFFSPATAGFLLAGFWTTILLTAFSIIIGTPLGIVTGRVACVGATSHLFGRLDRGRLARNRSCGWALSIIRGVTVLYIDLVRAVPLLVLLLIAYYGLPALLRHQMTAFETSVVAMSINLSVFVADLLRGAVAGVPKGYIMAGKSLGMNDRVIWRRVVLPEALRDIVPSMTLLYITIFKMSTLASVVTVYEVLHSADDVIQRTYRPLELYLAVALLFVLCIVPLSALARRLESSKLVVRRPT